MSRRSWNRSWSRRSWSWSCSRSYRDFVFFLFLPFVDWAVVQCQFALRHFALRHFASSWLFLVTTFVSNPFFTRFVVQQRVVSGVSVCIGVKRLQTTWGIRFPHVHIKGGRRNFVALEAGATCPQTATLLGQYALLVKTFRTYRALHSKLNHPFAYFARLSPTACSTHRPVRSLYRRPSRIRMCFCRHRANPALGNFFFLFLNIPGGGYLGGVF